jgi:hypothetical protein
VDGVTKPQRCRLRRPRIPAATQYRRVVRKPYPRLSRYVIRQALEDTRFVEVCEPLRVLCSTVSQFHKK